MTMRNTHYFFEILFTLSWPAHLVPMPSLHVIKPNMGLKTNGLPVTILTVITTVRFI